jgi:type IV pilus assembly protein PilC
MPVYTFEAMDGAGKVVREDVEAANRDDAIAQIRAMGFFPTKLKERAAGAPSPARSGAGAYAEQVPARRRSLFGGVKFKDLAQFTVQLATLQDAGLPIVRSLRILEGQMRPGNLKNQVEEIAEDVEGGNSFSDALAKHPKTFDRLYVNMVKAGEAGGVLETILNRLSDFLEKSMRLKRRIIGASIYPIVVLTVAVIIIAGIMVLVIPKFEQMFSEQGFALPATTELLLYVARLVQNYWFLLPAIPIGLYVLLKLLQTSAGGRAFIDRMKLKIPLMGPVLKKSYVARFARTLGTLIGAGVPILDALSIVKEAVGNIIIEDAIEDVYGSIKEGETVAGPLKASGVFDDVFVNMVDVGEETGELDKMLNKIAENYEDEVDVAVESMTSVIEPILIVTMGAIVGFVVVSLFMPLVSLIEQIG